MRRSSINKLQTHDNKISQRNAGIRTIKLKTYEGIIQIKWYKNDSGDRRPLTIDVENKETLKIEINRIKMDFLKKGENGKLPYSVKIAMNERK
jgi:hypothetical protein